MSMCHCSTLKSICGVWNCCRCICVMCHCGMFEYLCNVSLACLSICIVCHCGVLSICVACQWYVCGIFVYLNVLCHSGMCLSICSV